MALSWPQQWQTSFRRIDDLLHYLQLSRSQLPILDDLPTFAFKVPRPFAERMKKGDPLDPLLLQVLPLSKELVYHDGFTQEPLQENNVNPLPGLLHKYSSRVLLTLSGSCAVNCRYCFRRNFSYKDNNPGAKGWEAVFNYISEHTEVREVILSGGDPLSVNDVTLDSFIKKLENIPSIKYLRFHTRLPIVIPARVTEGLLNIFKNTRFRISMVLHTNHANEWDGALKIAMRELHDAGVTLLNQSVLLRGVNDSSVALSDLSYCLYDMGVLPYYLHLLDTVSGSAHFYVDDARAIVLMRELIDILPGYLVPKLVREISGRSSKIPIDLSLGS